MSARSGARNRPRPLIRERSPSRSGEISAPSCRSTRALERASSDVSAPPMWLSPRPRAAKQQCPVGDALVARSANGAAHPHRSSPRRNSRAVSRYRSSPCRSPASISRRSSATPRSTLESASPSGVPVLQQNVEPHLRTARREAGGVPRPAAVRHPAQPAVGQRLGQGIGHRLRQVAGPGQLPVVGVASMRIGCASRTSSQNRMTPRAARGPPRIPLSQT